MVPGIGTGPDVAEVALGSGVDARRSSDLAVVGFGGVIGFVED